MLRRRWLIAVALLVGMWLAVTAVSLRARATRWTPAFIRTHVLSIIPLGSSVSSAEAALRTHRWHEGMCWVEGENKSKEKIMFQYGHFYELRHLPFPTSVEVHLSFGPDGGLTDLEVKRYPE